MRATNLTLLTDLYELTMMQGYFKNPSDQIVVFDAFYRRNPCDGGYAISCGLADVIEYIKNLHFSYDDIQYLKSLNIFEDDFLDYLAGFHFTGDIWGIPEGTVIFPREPMLKVIAPIMQGRMPTICTDVTTVTTPGEDVDVVVTDYGIAINPRRQDLIEATKGSKLPLKTIEELRDIAYAITGEPEPVQFGDRVVGIIEARDGTIMDVVRQIKKFEFKD